MPYLDPVKQRAAQLRIIKGNRSAWLAANGPCRRCRSWRDLQVDHIDPSTKVSHRVWSWAPARREGELKKCQPLCKPCHLAKTREDYRVRFPFRHGTNTTYQRGCRCADCRRAGVARALEYAQGLRGRKALLAGAR